MSDFSYLKKERLTQEEIVDLQEVSSLIARIRSRDSDDAEADIKKLCKMHIIVKSFMSNIRKQTLYEEDIATITAIDKEVNSIVNPVYDQLIEIAIIHCEQFFIRIRKAAGDVNPKLYPYQKKMLKFLLRSVIKNPNPNAATTLLVSRGAGKTWTMSLAAVFLSLYWKSYLYRVNESDFTCLITAGYDKSLASFRTYCKEMLSICVNAGIIAKLESQNSEIGGYEFKNNNEEYVIRDEQGSNHCRMIWKLAAESLEGIHASLLMADEFKMVDKSTFLTSILPCAGGRAAPVLLMSSASEYDCYFQQLCETNYNTDLEKMGDGNTTIAMEKKWGEKGFEITGERLFVQHYSKMIAENRQYALTIDRALDADNGDDNSPSFLSQYHNIFSNKISSEFFDISTLQKRGTFEPILEHRYKENNRYVIVAGLDLATSGEDSSVLTIKALDNKFGVDRRSYMIAQICLNPSRDPINESVYAQMESVAYYIHMYGITGIAVDVTGVGQGAHEYLKQVLVKNRERNFNPDNVVPVYFTQKTKLEMMEFYHSRIQGGLEHFDALPFEDMSEEFMRRQYGLAWKKFDTTSMYIKFLHEHQMFTRLEIKKEDTQEVKVVFVQDPQRYMHDDTIFSSALCSYVLNQKPMIMKSVKVDQMTANPYKANKFRTWK